MRDILGMTHSGLIGGPPKDNFSRMTADIKFNDLKTGSFIRKVGVLGWSSDDHGSPFRANLGQVLISSPEIPQVKVEPLSATDLEKYPSEKIGGFPGSTFFNCRLSWTSSASHHAIFYDRMNADGTVTDTDFIGMTTSQEGFWATEAEINELVTDAKFYISYMDSYGEYTTKAQSPVFNLL